MEGEKREFKREEEKKIEEEKEREIFEEFNLSPILEELKKKNEFYLKCYFGSTPPASLLDALLDKKEWLSLLEEAENDAHLMNQEYPSLEYLGLTIQRAEFLYYFQNEVKEHGYPPVLTIQIEVRQRERLFRYLDFLIGKEELKEYQRQNLFDLANVFWEEIYDLDWKLMELESDKVSYEQREMLDRYRDEKLEFLSALPFLSEKFKKIFEKIRAQEPDFSPPFAFEEIIRLKEIFDHNCFAQYCQALKYGIFLPFSSKSLLFKWHTLSPLEWHTLLNLKEYRRQWDQILFKIEEWVESIDSEEGKKVFSQRVFDYFNMVKKELLLIFEKSSNEKERVNFPTFRAYYLKFLRYLEEKLKKYLEKKEKKD